MVVGMDRLSGGRNVQIVEPIVMIDKAVEFVGQPSVTCQTGVCPGIEFADLALCKCDVLP